MGYLLDTCTVSELIARTQNPKVVQAIDALGPDETYLSAVTIGEIIHGIERLPPSRRRRELETWLRDVLLVRFHGQILAVDLDVASRWGRLMAELEPKGRKMGIEDSLIAATALAHGLTLVTRNDADFAHAGLPLLNPWKP